MDKLWDDTLEEAWKKVERQDYCAESSIAFLFGIPTLILAMSEVSDAWKIVADAKMQSADGHDRKIREEGGQPKSHDLYTQAHTLIKDGKRSDLARDRIELFRRAIERLEQFIARNNR